MTTTEKVSNKIVFSPIAHSRVPVSIDTTLACPNDEEIGFYEHNVNFGLFRIIDQKEGDKRLVWNRLNLSDINEAHSMFNKFIKEGLAAYRVGSDGKQGQQIEEFDPTAEEIIFLPVKLIVGG